MALSEDYLLQSCPGPYCNVVFMNQLGRGPAQGSGQYSLNQVRQMVAPKTKLIVRAVNLRRHHPGYTIRSFLKNKLKDSRTLALLRMADHVIFQSRYQYEVFSGYGFKGKSWSIIHNGAGPEFAPADTLLDCNENLKFIACSIGGREIKCHPLMVELARVPGVEMHYVGKWPGHVVPGSVILHGVLSAVEIAALMKTMHYCFHPAIKDICPNAVCEALASGLPVIYNPAPGGTVELASLAGLALQLGDLPAMVRKARQQYPELSRLARQQCAYYSFNRVLREYKDVFAVL